MSPPFISRISQIHPLLAAKYLARRAKELEREGLSPDEAASQARAENPRLGNRAYVLSQTPRTLPLSQSG